MSQPNLLVSRILKSRYYKGKSLWEMEPRPSDSWMWRSLLSSRYVLESGIRKRIGDGKIVNNRNDRWLPKGRNGKVRTIRTGKSRVQKVSELIKNGEWDQRLLQEIFQERDANEIMTIPK